MSPKRGGGAAGTKATKLVVFADLHLDRAFEWASTQVGRRKRQALRDALVRIVDLVEEVGADALLCAGDLYEHDRISADTADFLRKSFERLSPRHVFLAPGNHDWCGPQSLYRTVRWPANVHIFTEPRLTPVPLTDGITLWGAAHCVPVNTPGFFEGFAGVRGEGLHLAVFHGSEHGQFPLQGEGKQPHAPFDEKDIERAGFDHAFVGHFHTPIDRPRLTYPGNPEPLTFGVTGAGGAVVASVAAGGAISVERRPVVVSRLHDIEVTVTSRDGSQEIRDRVAARLRPLVGSARVTLVGQLAPHVALHPDDLSSTAPPKLEPVIVRILARHAYDFDAISKEPTVRGQFVRDVLADEDLDTAIRERVLSMGLRALDGYDDLEEGL